MIQFDKVSKRHNKQTALNQVSFALRDGEMAFLTGHSGAGKSTLLNLILCLEQATAGQIFLGNRSITAIKSRHIPLLRRQLGFISQEPNLLNDRSVFQNVALPLIIDRWCDDDLQGRTMAALEKVQLRHKANCRPHELSCGEQQRINIARAIVHKPAILLADEPTGNLDPELAKDIMALFSELNQCGMTILIATHALDLIAQLPYRILTLAEGQLVGDNR